MSIKDADYILSVSGDGATAQNVATLVQDLQAHGFGTQARPGTGSSVLVFARLSASAYGEAVSRDSQKAAAFGVSARDDVPAERPRIVYSYLTSPVESKGVGITPAKGKWQFIDAILANSAFLADQAVAQSGKKVAFSPSLTTPNLVKTHGTQVALYFEFLRFYISALAVLSLFGAVAYIKAKTYSLAYAFVNLAWGISFLLLWKRKERTLANLWGVQNAHKVEEHDAALASAANSAGSNNSAANSRGTNGGGARFVRELAFVPVALVFVAVLVSYQLSCFVLEIFLSEIYDGPGKAFLTLVPTVLISVFVPVLTIIYNAVVDRFLTWEGHTNTYTRYDSFVVKTFTLNFLTGYVPLLITSFIYLPFAHFIQPELPVIQTLVAANIHHDRYAYKFLSKIKSQREFTINQARLDGQFFYFIVTNQIISFVLRYGLPLVVPRVVALVKSILGKKEASVPVDVPEEKEWLSNVRRYILLPEHNVHDDYRGLCLQFGYLAMFGPVWTLAPLLSLVFNVITYKLDTLKVTGGTYFRPPVPKRADSIHPWDHAFFLLAWLGSIISPAVAAFYRHGTKPPKPLGQFAIDKASVNVSSSTCLWLTLFAAEHLFFFLFFLGSKATSVWRSEREPRNSVQYSEKPAVAPSHGESSASDWKPVSVAEIQKQAKGTGKTVDHTASQSSTKATSAGSSTGVAAGAFSGAAGAAGAAAAGNSSTLTNRNAKLEELEAKMAQLERVKATLEKKQLEAQKEAGDSVISTIDAQGNKVQAIIDGDSHIPMDDVNDIEQKLTRNEEELAKNKKETLAENKEKSLGEKSPQQGSTTPSDIEKDAQSLRSEARKESSEQASISSKPSKKASIKKLFKRG